MPLPTEEDYIEAVQILADFLGTSGFPKGATARTLVVRFLQEFVESKEALDWLVEATVKQLSDWRDAGGMATLRAIYSQKYRPLDEVEEPEFVLPPKLAERPEPEDGIDPKTGLLPPLPFPEGAFSFDPPGVTTYKEKWMHTLPIWARKGYDPKTKTIKDPVEDQKRKERDANNVRAALLDILRAQQEREAREEKAEEPQDDPDKTDDDPEEK